MPTAGEKLILPKEYLMGRTVAEVENLINPSDADVFTGNTQHGFHALLALLTHSRKIVPPDLRSSAL